MSVKMALAKLCACACGGAIIGGGAMHVTEHPRPRIHHAKVVKHRRVAPVAQRRVVRHVRRTVQTACASGGGTTVTTIASRAPIPQLPPMSARDAAYDSGPFQGGSGGASFIPVVGGSGGFGGGFGGGFSGGFGGGGSGGGSVVISSTSSGGSTSTGGSGGSSSSTSSGGSGGSSTSTGGLSSTSTSSTGGSSSSTSGGNLSSTSSSSGNISTSSASSSSTSGSTSTSGSSSTSTSTGGYSTTGGWSTSGGHHGGSSGDPHPVPAPPMVLLFGLGAAALVARSRFTKKLI